MPDGLDPVILKSTRVAVVCEHGCLDPGSRIQGYSRHVLKQWMDPALPDRTDV